MAYNAIGGFPSQQLSFNKKNRVWRKKCVDFDKNVENDFIVYMHINKINGHVYVGITHCCNPNKRWGYSGQKYKHSIKFFNAIKKYGWTNFDHIILCRTTKDVAILLEKVLIAHYKRLKISYNLADGGEGTDCITDNNRKKISERMKNNHPMKGKHHTLEARLKISEAGKKRVYTEEQKNQIRRAGKIGRQTMIDRGWWMSETSRQKTSERMSKAVLQLDQTGNIIERFKSALEADKIMSKGKGHHISDVCNGKRKSAYGYKWVYEEKEEKGGINGL